MSDNRENWEGVQNLKWGSQVYAKSRFGVSKNPKFSPCERGGDTPLSFDRTPPSFLKTGRARRQNFIAFLGSLGLDDRFEPNLAK